MTGHFYTFAGCNEWFLVCGYFVGLKLDRTSMSQMFVSCLYAIGGGWLKILATSVHACRRLDSFSK